MTFTEELHNILNTWQRRAMLAAVIGVALCGPAAMIDYQQLLRSYLVAFLFWWGVTLGCLGILMLHYLVGGRWGAAARPILECGGRTIVLTALLFLPIALGLETLYPWAHPSQISGHNSSAAHAEQNKLPVAFVAADQNGLGEKDVPVVKPSVRKPSAQKITLYLNPKFYLGRALGYFVVWSLLARLLRSRPTAVGIRPPLRREMVSAGGLVVLALTITFAAIDWAMSITPEWYSTIYGALFFIGGALAGMAFVTFVAAWLEMNLQPRHSFIAKETLNDLATLLLAFLMLWAYFAYSQFLIIWSGNLPEESIWYFVRLRGGWQYLGWAIVLFQFAVPFCLLLSRDLKRNAQGLARVAALVFFMQYVYFLWTVAPSFHPEKLFLHWADAIALIAVGGLWTSLFLWQLQRRARWILPLKNKT